MKLNIANLSNKGRINCIINFITKGPPKNTDPVYKTINSGKNKGRAGHEE